MMLKFHPVEENIGVKHFVENEHLFLPLCTGTLVYLEEKDGQMNMNRCAYQKNLAENFLQMNETKTNETSYLTSRRWMKPSSWSNMLSINTFS